MAKHQLVRHSQRNDASGEALKLLNKVLFEHQDDQVKSVAEDFRNLAIKIWQQWRDRHSQNEDNQSQGKHPVISRLESEEWLKQI